MLMSVAVEKQHLCSWNYSPLTCQVSCSQWTGILECGQDISDELTTRQWMEWPLYWPLDMNELMEQAKARTTQGTHGVAILLDMKMFMLIAAQFEVWSPRRLGRLGDVQVKSCNSAGWAIFIGCQDWLSNLNRWWVGQRYGSLGTADDQRGWH